MSKRMKERPAKVVIQGRGDVIVNCLALWEILLLLPRLLRDRKLAALIKTGYGTASFKVEAL